MEKHHPAGEYPCQVELNFCVWLDHPCKEFKASWGTEVQPTKNGTLEKTDGGMELFEYLLGLIKVCVCPVFFLFSDNSL